MLNNKLSGEMESSIPKKRAGIREFRKERKIILFSPYTNLECHLSGPARILWDGLFLNLETRVLKQLISSALEDCSVPIPLEFSVEFNCLLEEMNVSGLIEFEKKA